MCISPRSPQQHLSAGLVPGSEARLIGCVLLVAKVALASASCLADTDSAQLRPVVISGMPASGGGTFDRFHVEGQPAITPVNDRGQVAFFATLARARSSEGMFLADGSRIQVIALSGAPVPGGGKLASFAAHPVPALNRAGDVAFTASIVGGKASEGLFLAKDRRLRAIAMSGSAASGIPGGAFSEFQPPALNDRGDVAFLAGVRRGRDSLEAIYLYRRGNLRKIAAAGDPAPEGGTFVAFGAPALNNSADIAFAAVIDDGPSSGGIIVVSARKARLLVGTGAPEPYGGIFAQFSDRVNINNSGNVLFNAVLKLGAVAQALFVTEGNEVRPVAAVGQASPSSSGFSALGLWTGLSDDGAAAFIAAADSTGTVGVYQADFQTASRRAAIGDALTGGGKVTAFPLYPAVASSPGGRLAFAILGEASGGEAFEAILVAPGPAD